MYAEQGGITLTGGSNNENIYIKSSPLRLQQIDAPSTTTDKLYNVSGNLTWNGEIIFCGTVQNYSNEVYASKVTKTDSAVGDGFDGTGSICNIFINKFGGEIITTIQIDITGLYGGTGGDKIIGKNEEASNFYQITSSNNGIVYKIELICIEAPLAGNSNGGQSYAIGLQVNPTDNGVEASVFNHNDDAAPPSTGYEYFIDATTYDQILGKYSVSVPPATGTDWENPVPTFWVNGLNNKFLHLYAGYGNGRGSSTNDAYTAGKFLVKLYGSTF